MTDAMEVKLLWYAATAEQVDEILTFGFEGRRDPPSDDPERPRKLGVVLFETPHAAAATFRAERMLLVALALGPVEWDDYNETAHELGSPLSPPVFGLPAAMVNRWAVVQYVPRGLWGVVSPTEGASDPHMRQLQRAERWRTLLEGADAEARRRRDLTP